MKALSLIISFFFICISLFPQQASNPPGSTELTSLSEVEMNALKEVPELTMPMNYRGKDLPAMVDNSTQPYMREVFQQHLYSCGQAAGIAYNFTYEIDRARDIPANINENMYPTHFTWNWMNEGYGYYGVSFLHSFEVLRHCGNMNIADYGGSTHSGGESRWISGYDMYYNGMGNRINEIYQIQIGTPEGLETFKHWINDHLEGAPVGGVGSFYSQYMNVSSTLPAGTPEEGKHVLTYFGGSANHAQTIVGYNDSNRWDYNNDGQYTNDIDINNDGVVDMKDWEIGGFKMVQSYGGVPNWGDQGYAYMMYKTVADDLGEGGIWNHCVYVLDVKETCEPQATMKVTLTHIKRDQIKVIAGVSNNVNASGPDYIMEFPILNYQGGGQYMQGGWSIVENRTLEFGLDISPLLSLINIGEDVKFFLQVYEYDPEGSGYGSINSFSVLDYTGGSPVEHVCSQSDVPINHNSLTSLNVVAGFDFDRVSIANAVLPAATVGQAYSVQLSADGGTAPYQFRILKQYDESTSSQSFPTFDQTQLYPNSSSNGFVTQQLDFDFPYFDSTYSAITVHVDGYLMFDEQLFPYPYFEDDMVMFRITRNISPFMCHGIRLYSWDDDGIWYEGDATQATFRWEASIDGLAGSTDLNFAVRLFPDGTIEYLYGEMDFGDDIKWVAGLNDGNEHDMQFSSFYPDALPQPDKCYEYEMYNYPEGLSISEDGLLSGVVNEPVNGESMTFKLIDNNFVYDIKTLLFSTTGIQIVDSVVSGDDNVIEFGELASLHIELTNLEGNAYSDVSMSISTEDPYINIIDNSENIGDLPVGVPVFLEDAFSFEVASDIPNDHTFELATTIVGSNKETWESTLVYTAYAPEIELSDVVIDDGENGRLDPGETADILVQISNGGGSIVSMLECILSTADPYITVNDANYVLPILSPDSSGWLEYNVTVDPGATIGHTVEFLLDLSGNQGYQSNLAFERRIGLTLEDFETGDFNLFSWGFNGNQRWIIDDDHPYEGDYCARSGMISHEQESVMILDIEVLEAGDLSFYRMVSCEDAANDDSDYLSFYVDGIEQARWDSIRGWEMVSFPLSTGYHRLEWKYIKDATVSQGLDAAFVDHINFPGSVDISPQLVFVPGELDKTMKPGEQDTDTLMISNDFEGELEFSILITSLNDRSGNRNIEGSYLECAQSAFYAGEEFNWDFTLYNTSEDDEWLTDLLIQLPHGVTAQGANNFVGGSNGDLMFTGSFGNGATMNWHFEDQNGWGAVKGGEYAYASINGVVESEFIEDAVIEYTITGDQFGGEPHVVEGSITLSNMGGIVPWISCDMYEGTVPSSATQNILVTFNTEGLADGDYYCNLIVRDNFQHETMIPVHLLVDTFLGQDEQDANSMDIEVFPNPFTDETRLSFNLSKEEKVTVRVADLQGRTIDMIAEGIILPPGNHQLSWNPENRSAGKGMFLIIFEHNGARVVKKVIRHE